MRAIHERLLKGVTSFTRDDIVQLLAAVDQITHERDEAVGLLNDALVVVEAHAEEYSSARPLKDRIRAYLQRRDQPKP